MTSCLGKSCSFGLPRVPFVNCCQFVYLVISLLVLRAGFGIRLYQFLIIAYLFTLNGGKEIILLGDFKKDLLNSNIKNEWLTFTRSRLVLPNLHQSQPGLLQIRVR